MSYITLAEAKSYIAFLDSNDNSFDSKLNIIINGVNAKIAKGTNAAPRDDELHLLACEWVEWKFSSIAGAKEQKEDDVTVKYDLDDDGVPKRFKAIMASYVELIEPDNSMTVTLI